MKSDIKQIGDVCCSNEQIGDLCISKWDRCYLVVGISPYDATCIVIYSFVNCESTHHERGFIDWKHVIHCYDED